MARQSGARGSGAVGITLTVLAASTLTGAALLTAQTAQAATTYLVQVSATANRAAPINLDGAIIKGNAFAFTSPATGVKTVSFWLDDPTHAGPATHTETTAPYDLAGGSATAAIAWDSTKVADGTHTLTQIVTPTTGAVQTTTATFSVTNAVVSPSSSATASTTPTTSSTVTASTTPTTSSSVTASGTATASGYSLQDSTVSSRANPFALDGATLTGNAYVFTAPGTGIKTVGFWLDDPTRAGPATHTETTGPYDFVGGSVTVATAWDTTKVADGVHTLTEVVTPTTGAAQVQTATFTVANGGTISSSASSSSSSASASSSGPISSSATATATATSSPSGSTPPGGSPGWGQLQPTNLDWTRSAAGTTIAGLLGPQLTNLRYEMNRIGFDIPDKTDVLHTKPDATVILRNTGTTPVTISAITTTGPFTLQTPFAGPVVIAPNTSLNVTVLFTYCRTGCTQATPKGVQLGSLIVNSDDPGFPAESVTLAGDWQVNDGGSNELTIQQIINTTFGIKTALTGPGTKYINYGNGLEAAVGDEVVSRYWKLATPGNASARQIVATHGPGGHEAFSWFTQGLPAPLHVIMQQSVTDYQTVLPGGNAGPSTENVFNPGTGTVFGFNINNGENTDPTLVSASGLANDVRHGCDPVATQCGHHTRMYPVKNAAGVVIPNLWLLAVDSNGTNLDFQDVIYLISNITPA